MPFPHYCAEPTCTTKIAEGRYCPNHVKESPAALNRKRYDAVRSDDPVRKWYSTARWARFRDAILRFNPMCMRRLPDGSTCRYPSSVVHHLRDPRQGGAFTDAANVVAVCPEHHHGAQGEPGSPTDWEKVYALPTRWEVHL
jgi:hypothetical protein